MKYVSRSACESRGALGGVIKEVELLSSLEHPFLVNLWFSFQGKWQFQFDLYGLFILSLLPLLLQQQQQLPQYPSITLLQILK